MCTISTPTDHMRTSVPPSAHVLVVCGPTAPCTPQNLSFHQSCSRGHAALPAWQVGEQGQFFATAPWCIHFGQRPLPRAPRGVQYGRPVARSRGKAFKVWCAERHRPAVGRCSPDFCSQSCIKMLQCPDVCINLDMCHVSGPMVGKAWQGALREDGLWWKMYASHGC